MLAAASTALLSGLFYITDIRSNLVVTPESAFALVRGLGAILTYSGFVWGEIPDRTRRAPFRDDDVEIAAELNRTAVGTCGDLRGKLAIGCARLPVLDSPYTHGNEA